MEAFCACTFLTYIANLVNHTQFPQRYYWSTIYLHPVLRKCCLHDLHETSGRLPAVGILKHRLQRDHDDKNKWTAVLGTNKVYWTYRSVITTDPNLTWRRKWLSIQHLHGNLCITHQQCGLFSWHQVSDVSTTTWKLIPLFNIKIIATRPRHFTLASSCLFLEENLTAQVPLLEWRWHWIKSTVIQQFWQTIHCITPSQIQV